jgi:hypothetical protein
MSTKLKKQLRKEVTRNYVARDFEAFRSQLLQFARTYFPDKIQDFSEASLGGLFLDMAAFVGDNMSFYLDHQFNELDFRNATESINIQRHLINAGVEIRGKSPASTVVELTFVIPSLFEDGLYKPNPSYLPKILRNSIFRGTNGVSYVTSTDIDYADLDFLGELIAGVSINTVNTDGSPASFNVTREIEITSGRLVTETFTIPDNFVPFRTIALSNPDVTNILSVYDTQGNDYYEVTDLSQDVIYRKVNTNQQPDESNATANLEVVPAPYRFVRETSLITRGTSIKFGSGDATTTQDDIIPDPSELALPLYGKDTFSRFTINPNNILVTDTLGITPRNTTITIVYMSGGGLNHNTGALTINSVSTLSVIFPGVLNRAEKDDILNSASVINNFAATGGADSPTVEELRAQIPNAKSSQSRVVTREDLLSRVYTLPNNFGRIYRAGVNPSPTSALASDLYIISRDSSGKLVPASDILKKNLRIYLNEYRLISEAIEIKDVSVINFGVKFAIVTRQNVNKLQVVQSVISRISNLLSVDNFQVDQPIIESDIIQAILTTQGVISLSSLEFFNLTGFQENRSYSDVVFDPLANTVNGIIVPPVGSMFELKFSNFDIIGNVI